MSLLKKYEFTGDIKEFDGRTLRRIRAVRDFGDVKAGAFGGWIEAESNLSHDGTAWVSDEAMVYGEALVGGEARVYDKAQVYGKALVRGEAWVYGEARVFNKARVFDKARVSGEARVYGEAWVFGEARVSGEAWVYGEARVFNKARVFDKARVYGEAWVFGGACVYGRAWVSGEARVTRNPITAQLTQDHITATDNHVQIGCQMHTYEHWLAHYKEIGREAGYSWEDIELYGSVIKALAARAGKKPMKKSKPKKKLKKKK